MLAVSAAIAPRSILAQNIISVPFTDGFIGTRGQSAGTANTVLTYATLGIARTFFIQNSSTNTFELQGNDMPGTLRIVRTNGTTLDIPASANWRNSGGSTYLIGILPRPSSPITFTYGGGSVQITDGSSPGGSSVGGYIAAYQGSTLSDGASTSGNAAQSQVLNGLNSYLATVVSSRPAGPVTVATLTTSNSTPTVTGSATVGASENLTVVVEGIQYSSVTSPAVVRNGTAWSLALVTPLSAGAHEITATITNVDGFTLSDATSNEVTITVGGGTVTIGGSFTANNKTYTGTTAATGTTAGLSLIGVNAPDVVTIASVTLAFQSAGVANGKTVVITGVTLGGTNGANYSVNLAGAPTATANVTAAPVSITGLTAASRVYDGTVSASLTGAATYSGLVNGETFSVSGTPVAVFLSSTVGSAKSVTVTGYTAPSANYSVTQPSGLTANITAAPLGITGVSASDKVYDATTAASLSGTAVYSGLVNGESFSVTGTPVASFSTAGVGTAKTVSVSGYSAPSANYTLTQPSALTANITSRSLTIAGTLLSSDKIYDGNTSATLNTTGLSLATVLGSDVVSLTSITGTFATAAVGAGKTVSIASANLTGAQASNYTLSLAGAPTATAAITSAGGTVTVSGNFTANNKIYDGTTSATGTTTGLTLAGVNAPDVVTIASVTLGFQSAGAASGKTVVITALTLGGANGTGYTVDLTGAPTASANISAATLGITGVTASNKTYDANAAATLTGTAAYSGLVNGESYSVTGAPVAAFGTADVGTARPVSVTGYTAPSANYSLVQPTGLTANVTARTLTIGGTLLASNKPFDGNASATLNTSGLTLVGVQGADVISLTSIVGAFASSAVGTGISVSLSSASLSGVSVSNYALSLAGAPATTASITAVGGTLTIGGSFSAASRVYDGTTTATGNTAGLTLVGVNGADQVTIASATMAFQSASAGTTKTVVITNVTLGGADVAGYSVNLAGAPTATADITPKPITITGVSAVGKTYDATAVAALSGVPAYVGLVNGESFTVGGTAAGVFSNADVGTSKPILVTGYSAPNANYSLAQPTGLTASITTRPVTIGGLFAALNKVFDGTTTATISNNQLTLANAIPGDAVQLGAVFAAFQSATAGLSKSVTLASASLGGVSAANYSLSLAGAPTTTADITSAGGILTVGGQFTANDKVYDKNTSATGMTGALTLIGKTPQDQVSIASVTLAFSSATVGSRTVQIAAVTLSGADAHLFTVSLAGAPSAPASITPKSLDVGGAFTAADKYFDGTTEATITSNTLVVVGEIGNDNVSLGNSAATFADAQVGRNKVVSLGTLALVGADAANYVLNTNSTATTTAAILAADAPSVPRNAELTAGDGIINVSWSVPQLSGCSEVNGYVLEYSTDGGQNWTRVSVPANPTIATLRGLVNSVAHRVRIAATNVCGNSPFATVIEPITPVGPSQTPPTSGPTSTTPRGPEPVTVEVVRDTTLQLTSGSVSLSLQSSDSAGHVIPVDSGHTLELEQGGRAKSEGRGFSAGSTVALYIYPANAAPILLGKVTVDAAGKFTANVPIPLSLAEGGYTLQVSGIDQTQTPRSIALGVQVTEPPADLELTSTPDQPSPAVGDTVIITLTVTNKGTGAAIDVVIPRAFREPGFNIIKTTAIDGRYDAVSQEWTISRIEPGARARMLLTVIVVPPPTVPAGQAGNQP